MRLKRKIVQTKKEMMDSLSVNELVDFIKEWFEGPKPDKDELFHYFDVINDIIENGDKNDISKKYPNFAFYITYPDICTEDRLRLIDLYLENAIQEYAKYMSTVLYVGVYNDRIETDNMQNIVFYDDNTSDDTVAPFRLEKASDVIKKGKYRMLDFMQGKLIKSF